MLQPLSRSEVAGNAINALIKLDDSRGSWNEMDKLRFEKSISKFDESKELSIVKRGLETFLDRKLTEFEFVLDEILLYPDMVTKSVLSYSFAILAQRAFLFEKTRSLVKDALNNPSLPKELLPYLHKISWDTGDIGLAEHIKDHMGTFGFKLEDESKFYDHIVKRVLNRHGAKFQEYTEHLVLVSEVLAKSIDNKPEVLWTSGFSDHFPDNEDPEEVVLDYYFNLDEMSLDLIENELLDIRSNPKLCSLELTNAVGVLVRDIPAGMRVV